jgi:hypothetical protein
VLTNRRGAVAVTFAVSATALIGMAALAGEAGLWLLQQRESRTAADLAALSGALALERGDDARAVALDTVRRNGFVEGQAPGGTTVLAASPPAAGRYAGDAYAIEVVVTQPQRLGLAGLVIQDAPEVRSRAVALSAWDVNLCLLALGGGLVLGEGGTTTVGRCGVAANAPEVGIRVLGSTQVAKLASTSDCIGCESGEVWTDESRSVRPPVQRWRPNPVVDPYRSLQTATLDSPDRPCRAPVVFTGLNPHASIAPSEGAVCSNLVVAEGEELTLQPGLYVFRGASLAIAGTGIIVSPGPVTLLFLRDASGAAGTLTVDMTASFWFEAPETSLVPGVPAAAGLLIYRDAGAADIGPAHASRLDLGRGSSLRGAIYMPTSDLQLTRSDAAFPTACMPVIAHTLTVAVTAPARLDVSGCADFAAVPQLRVARLVE